MNFLERFSKSTQISNTMKIRPVDAAFLHADGQTDKAKLIVAFRNSAKAPKNALEVALNEICTDAYLFDLFHTKTGAIQSPYDHYCIMALYSMKVQCIRTVRLEWDTLD